VRRKEEKKNPNKGEWASLGRGDGNPSRERAWVPSEKTGSSQEKEKKVPVWVKDQARLGGVAAT